jgi:hypothetical protein
VPPVVPSPKDGVDGAAPVEPNPNVVLGCAAVDAGAPKPNPVAPVED